MSFYGDNLTQLTTEYDFEPRKGYASYQRFHGTPTEILNKAAAAQTLGLRHQVRELSQGGYQEIIIYYGATDTQNPDVPLADLWSMEGNENEKSVWYLDKMVDMFNTGAWSTQDLADLRGDIEALLSGDPTITVAAILAAVDPSEVTLIDGFIRSLMRGTEVKPLSAPVLRRRLVVTPNTNLRGDLLGVDKIISKTNLVAGSDPSGTPPSTILCAVRDGWWRKKHPTFEQTSSTTWEISQEWWWIGEVYDPFIWTTYP